MIVNLTVLQRLGVHQEMMPETRSVEAFPRGGMPASIACCRALSMLAPARRAVRGSRGVRWVVLSRPWAEPVIGFVDVTIGGTDIRLNVSRSEGAARFA